MSHVLRLGMKRSPTVPLLPREELLLRDFPSLPTVAVLRVSRDLEGDLLVFNETESFAEFPPDPVAELGAARNRDGDKRRDAERERPPDKLRLVFPPATFAAAARSWEVESDEPLPLAPDGPNARPCLRGAIFKVVSNLRARLSSCSI